MFNHLLHLLRPKTTSTFFFPPRSPWTGFSFGIEVTTTVIVSEFHEASWSKSVHSLVKAQLFVLLRNRFLTRSSFDRRLDPSSMLAKVMTCQATTSANRRDTSMTSTKRSRTPTRRLGESTSTYSLDCTGRRCDNRGIAHGRFKKVAEGEREVGRAAVPQSSRQSLNLESAWCQPKCIAEGIAGGKQLAAFKI